MLHNEEWLKKRIKKLESSNVYLVATVGYLLSVVRGQITLPAGGNGSVIFRDAPSDPESAPSSPTINTVLIYRDGSPSKYWDATNTTWI